MRTAVVGHVEWVEFARVELVPRPGEIVQASEWWAEAAGGGGVASVRLAQLAGDCTLFTALGQDELGDASFELLGLLGRHDEVSIRVLVDPLDGLAGVAGHDLVHEVAHDLPTN